MSLLNTIAKKKLAENNKTSGYMEIFALCLLVNTSTRHDIFCRFSGHTNSLNICVYKEGWIDGEYPSFQETIYESEKDAEIINYFKELLNKTPAEVLCLDEENRITEPPFPFKFA
ncbi:MAG: hypothetical protein COA44_04635 [Arcobacter sp.]|nr:MAG: hypothetical protein COA44_04635 [Arcobacter sp.]